MCVDGHEPDFLQELMEIEIKYTLQYFEDKTDATELEIMQRQMKIIQKALYALQVGDNPRTAEEMLMKFIVGMEYQPLFD